MSFQQSILRECGFSDDIVEAPYKDANGQSLKFREDGTVLQDTWMPESHRKRTLRQSIAQTKTVLGAVLRMRSWHKLPADVLELIRFYRAALHTPGDTTFLLGGHQRLKEVFAEASAGLLHAHSGLANEGSARHLMEAQAIKWDGGKIAIDIFPHTSLFDPHALRGILLRTRDRVRDTILRGLSDDLLNRSLFIVGQKVWLSRIQRAFSPFDKLLTIQPRYKAANERFARAHNGVAGKIADGIRAHRNRWLAVYPEAGRTKNNRIGIDERIARMTAMSKYDWHLPMFLDMPPDLFDPDKDMRDAREIPAKLFVGKPFRMADSNTDYVTTVRKNLYEVGAPQTFTWGTTKLCHEAPPSDPAQFAAWQKRVAQSGLDEEFTPLA